VFATKEMLCKYCGKRWTLRAPADEIDLYLSCCTACYENDEPGMARYERMAAMMGTAWAIDHVESHLQRSLRE
jgi:hypothetical protein